ncbi:MAG: hypothetical protein F6K35_15600 [Okeania sp. SIO2H7]|nr:hypothetical protein [Okeania sp. SIO2H7]
MNNYVINIMSFYPQKATIFPSLLTLPTVSKLIFPATLPTHPQKGIELNYASEFDFNLVPQEFSAESQIRIPLYGKNGIKFSCSIDEGEEIIVPNVVNFKFNSEHLDRGIVSLDKMLALLAEVIPVFQGVHASVYCQDLDAEPRYYRTTNSRYYPIEINWVNYFGAEIVNILGRKRFDVLKSCAYKYDFHDGILVILQDDPFDLDNSEHKKRASQAEVEVGFLELGKEQLAGVSVEGRSLYNNPI